jgi:hypothetical protein
MMIACGKQIISMIAGWATGAKTFVIRIAYHENRVT